MQSRSIRFRLTLWYVLTLAVILAASGFFLYIFLRGQTPPPSAQTLTILRDFFFLFFPVAFMVLSMIGWMLAGRAVAPMVRMAQVAGEINAEKLHLRLPVEHSGDEIARLAENCNAMLARLETSFRKLRQFSGDASHELRTPLAILRGETEVTLRWARDAEEYRRTLESNLEEITRMGRIIDDLLTLAKSDAGELSLVIGELSLSDLLQELYMQANTWANVNRSVPICVSKWPRRSICMAMPYGCARFSST